MLCELDIIYKQIFKGLNMATIKQSRWAIKWILTVGTSVSRPAQLLIVWNEGTHSNG